MSDGHIDDLDDDLDDALIKAHQEDDFITLIRLYKHAAEAQEALGDIDAACFYYTHAYVFALQEGAAEAMSLSAKLAEYGRDAALD